MHCWRSDWLKGTERDAYGDGGDVSRYRAERPVRNPSARCDALADVSAAPESELLAPWWKYLDLSDLDPATITFRHQVDRSGGRMPLKTEESMATLPLPRCAAFMLVKHRARSGHTGPFVFATRSGRRTASATCCGRCTRRRSAPATRRDCRPSPSATRTRT
jgi:hypothetical protein